MVHTYLGNAAHSRCYHHCLTIERKSTVADAVFQAVAGAGLGVALHFIKQAWKGEEITLKGTAKAALIGSALATTVALISQTTGWLVGGGLLILV